MPKKNYTQEEALEEVFENIKPSVVGKAEYDKMKIYQSRHESGKLGQKAIQSLLSNYGFIGHTYYIKKERTKSE